MADATAPAPLTVTDRIALLLRSRGMRFLIMLTLVFLMAIPIFMVWGVVADRAAYNRQAIAEVSDTWGGRVGIVGPVVHIPVTRTVTKVVRNPDGTQTTRTEDVEAEPVILLPERTDIDITITGQIRKRGIFEVPVYAARIAIASDFDRAKLGAALRENERMQLDAAQLILKLPARRSFFGETNVVVDGKAAAPEPGTSIDGVPGIRIPVRFARNTLSADLQFGLNGAQSLSVSPVARTTQVNLTSDWPDPSFAGAFLPNERNIDEAGFTARWNVPHLALDLPPVSRGAHVLRPAYRNHTYYHHDGLGPFSDPSAFGVRFFQTLDFYHQVERAVKYGFLFISLTFLTLFLLENLSRTPVHPAQFILIGIAECVFFLLLLSFAEQVGFGAAYLFASGATIGLLGYYGLTALRLGRRVWVLVAMLALLYLVLYFILQSTDYALLVGSVMAFGAVAATMIATRSEAWYRDATGA